MSQHHTTIEWQRAAHPTEAETFSRNHVATLNGGQKVTVSASAEYKGDPDASDPEQLLLTALASCHMLTFLAIAARCGLHENAILIAQRQRQAVNLWLSRIGDGPVHPHILAHTVVKIGDIAIFKGIFQRQHPHLVADLAESFGQCAPDLLRRALIGCQLRESGFQRQQAALQPIILGIRDQGLVVLVVGGTKALDLDS